MITAQALLTLALSLLIAAQQPYVTPELRAHATQVANTAIAYANVEIAKATQPASNTGDSTTYTPPLTSTPQPETPVFRLEVMRADQEDTGRWNNEKGHGCYRTSIYVAVFKDGVAQKDVTVSRENETQLTATTLPGVTDSKGVKIPLARFVFQPENEKAQVIRFSSNDATVDYVCQ